MKIFYIESLFCNVYPNSIDAAVMNELFDACGFIDRIFMQVSYGEIIALFWEVEISLFTNK
jgi:hypothetical protein